MNDATKHTILQLATAIVGAAAAAIAAQYPNRQDLVYAIATIVSFLMGSHAIAHVATIRAAGTMPTVPLTPMAPTIRTEAPVVP